MSAQLFELLFFAIVAFLIISKLIATLGTTNEDDPTKYKSYFGEQARIKDVTNSVASPLARNLAELPPELNKDLEGLIVEENEENILQGLSKLRPLMPNFDMPKFVRGAKAAFNLIIETARAKNEEELASLVDKRYLEKFRSFASNYQKIDKIDDLQGRISDIYIFGNNVFVKMLFTGSNIVVNQKEFAEEWTFNKSAIVSSPDWYLTNIEQL